MQFIRNIFPSSSSNPALSWNGKSLTFAYYDLLGVGKTANPDEIKKAFHQLARQHHPDRNGNKDYMALLNKAYAVLSDPE